MCNPPRYTDRLRFYVQMRETESPDSKKLGPNGRAIKMVPTSEIVKRRPINGTNVDIMNDKKQVVNGADVVNDKKLVVIGVNMVRREPNGAIVRTPQKYRDTAKLPLVEGLKVLPSDESFNWANKNYSNVQRTIDVWSFILSLRVRVLFDNSKWAYVGGFSKEKQIYLGC